jgi:RNA recognition motif-containing protein
VTGIVRLGQRKEAAISSKVFVGNLSFDATKQDIRTLFTEIAEPVEVPTDRMSGRPRGFAFVEFANPEQAAEAIRKLDGYELAGRRLRVNQANPERPAGGPGRSFGSPDRMARRPPRPKGSRRHARARKRSIW